MDSCSAFLYCDGTGEFEQLFHDAKRNGVVGTSRRLCLILNLISIARKQHATDYFSSRVHAAAHQGLEASAEHTVSLSMYLDLLPDHAHGTRSELRVEKARGLRNSIGKMLSVCSRIVLPGLVVLHGTGAERRHVVGTCRSISETQALLEGIEECGVGKWADIQRLRLPAIIKRSPVDLKDKWRNLSRLAQDPNTGRANNTVPRHFLLQVRRILGLHC